MKEYFNHERSVNKSKFTPKGTKQKKLKKAKNNKPSIGQLSTLKRMG